MMACLPGLAASLAECRNVSRRRKNAIFEVAARFTLIAEKVRSGGETTLQVVASTERRKALRIVLELAVSGGGQSAADRVQRRILEARATDPGERLETLMLFAGLRSLLAGEHPFVMFRRMTAFLGFEFREETDEWLAVRIARRRPPRQDDLLVPGELPDILRSLSRDKTAFERVIRMAGRDIMAACLAGCPRESLSAVREVFGSIGSAVLEDTMLFLRSRLSTEEIAAAQGAFLEVLRETEARNPSEPEGFSVAESDRAFVRELSRIILDFDERSLRTACAAIEGSIIARAMQGMEPVAHERILSALRKRDEKRILDSIDSFDPLGRQEIETAATVFLARIAETARRSGRLPPELAARIGTLTATGAKSESEV